MHNNYFFLLKVTENLETRLKDSVVSACFSQNKDELIIQLETPGKPFLIKSALLSTFSCLSFPENFNRARMNSVDLFGDLIGLRVASVHQFTNERSFVIQFTHNYSLLFKLHGNRSNLVLFKESVLVGIFKNGIKGDFNTKLAELDRVIDWSPEAFNQHRSNLEKLYYTFGKVVWRYLADNGFYTHTPEQQWEQIKDVLRRLNNPTYYIAELDHKLTFTLLPVGKTIQEHQDPLTAINDFFASYTQFDTFGAEMLSALTRYRHSLQAGENYIEKAYRKIQSLETENSYKVWADLVMANLHTIPSGTELVTLPNFYEENHPIEIKLRKALSPQKNAEVFYTKAKKQQLEIIRLQQSIVQKKSEIEDIGRKIEKLESVSDLKSLRNELKTAGFNKTVEKQTEPLPYHEFLFKGYKIYVGKNASSNDKLTTGYSHKDDLWLHAKDVAGSHVLIKHQSGKKFPKDVIERGAQLAAYFSKRKNESLCPVVVTPRKYVRKRKGDPPGSVIVEREEVILVEPKP